MNTPVAGSIAAPAGAPVRMKVRPLAGTSGSPAVATKLMTVCSSTVCGGIGFKVGCRLISFTVMVIICESASGGAPESVTTTSNV